MSEVNPPSPMAKFRALATQRAIPLQASLELTYRCNERCTHCYIEDFKDDPRRVLNEQQWVDILHKLRGAGVLYLVLMGGEAMLSPHFWPIARKARELNFYVSMISNGLKIRSLEVAQELREAGVQHVSFSLYSLQEEIHDKMTSVRGSLGKTLKAIEWSDQAGLQLGINVLLTEANARTVFEIYDWAAERNYEVKVDPTVTPKLNGHLAPTRLRATKETLQWFYRERAKRWARGAPRSNNEKPENFVCNVARGKCAVTPYGELLPCIEIRESMGSLADEPFEKIWQSPTALKWRNLKVKDLKNAGDIDEYNFCDHCPGMALHEHGKPMEPTDYSRQVAQVKQSVAKEALDGRF